MQVIANSSAPGTLSPFEHAVDQLELAVAAPPLMQRVLALLADGSASWRDLERVLIVDAGLVARILRLASSPPFAARPVRDLGFALQTLGADQLRRVVVAAQFAGRGSAFARGLWEYGLRVAFTTDLLARAAQVRGGPDPFLCGLLHDLGTMALAQIFGRSYEALGFTPGDDRQLAIEREHLGFDHADLGAMVVERWHLFPELVLVAQLHHAPEACELLGVPAATRAAIELVALARLVGRAADDPATAQRDALCDRLGLTVAVAEACAGEGRQRAAEITAGLA